MLAQAAHLETTGEELCPECGGSGWVVEADGGVGRARRCPCHTLGRGARLLEAAEIPPRYRRCRLSKFETAERNPNRKAQLVRALADCKRYTEHFLQPEGHFRETGLLFIGPPGVGKTHLAVAVLVELIERLKVRGRFVELTSLVNRLQNTFDPGSPDSKRDILDPIVNAELLVLDELGAQNPTPWVRDLLYLIINTRYTRRLPTLFTTNYRLSGPPKRTEENLDRGPDPEEDRLATERYGLLAHRLPPMLISRLFEMAKPILLDAASDYRQEVQLYRHRD
jgi:DNA replication protein DnaC